MSEQDAAIAALRREVRAIGLLRQRARDLLAPVVFGGPVVVLAGGLLCAALRAVGWIALACIEVTGVVVVLYVGALMVWLGWLVALPAAAARSGRRYRQVRRGLAGMPREVV